MTNCKGVTRKISPGPKDKTIACGTFRKTSREQWLKIVGDYHELCVGTSIPYTEKPKFLSLNILSAIPNNSTIHETPLIDSLTNSNDQSLNDLRAARLRRFNTTK